MENKIHISKLADIYDISNLLAKNVSLAKKDYKVIAGRKYRSGIDNFIFGRLSLTSIPEKYQDIAIYVDSFCQSWDRLIQCVMVPIPLENGLIYESMTTLFDLITKHHKFPIHKYLDTKSKDLPTEIDNYYKCSILRRFFQNQGVVFYSELLKIFGVPMVTEDVFTKTKINYYDKLIDDGILRKATPNDTSLILKYQTKLELIQIIKKLLPNEISAKKLENLNKTELIQFISDKNEITQINLHQHFYLLSDTAQEYKNWLVIERLYFNLYEAFENSIKYSGTSTIYLMKNLININNDYETAYKLGLIFHRHLNDYNGISKFNEYSDLPKVETQMKKIEKYYTDKAKPTIQTIGQDIET